MSLPPLDDLIAALQQFSHYRTADYERLKEMIGEAHLQARLSRQLKLYQTHLHPLHRRGRKQFQRVYRQLISGGLWCGGQLQKARAQARQPEWVEQVWHFEKLPAAFEGFRILQLSDFHFDFIPELPSIVGEMVAQHPFDVCVLTGDFRGETTGPYEASLAFLKATRPCLGERVYAVLGNHDNVELMLSMPEIGIQVLMNQSLRLEKDGASILLAGIDDPHYYRTHLLEDFAGELQAHGFAILLSHSPEAWREAAAAGFDLQLSGHTHGGQLCLPGGLPLVCHLEGCPRRMIRGRWQAGELQGYTSRGVGSSSLDLRLNCPPEITVHVLRGPLTPPDPASRPVCR